MDHKNKLKMEMDWGTAMVGIVVLTLFVVPFVLDHRSRANKAKLALRSLQAIAQQHNCNVGQHGSCGHTALGLDERRNALIYCNNSGGVLTAKYVDLAEIRACEAVKAIRNLKGVPGESITESVELTLQPKDRSKQEYRFELYREGLSPRLIGELEFVDKWSKLINARLNGIG